MSKLLKTKFLLGIAIFALAAVVTTSANAAITSTLKKGMRSAQVTELQKDLNVTPATGYFGNLTLAAVKAFQSAHGLTADGIFGAKSRAVLSGGTVSTTFPAGCTSTAGFSSLTGTPCNGSTSTVVSNPTGPLSVQLASDNPASGVLVGGQATGDLMHFTFSGSGTINNITLQRTGITANTALTNVYLYNGASRITDSASVNTNGVISFNGVNFPVNGSAVISVKADIDSTLTGGTVGVALTGYTVAGSTSATVANISGNLMSITTGTNILGSVNFSTIAGTTPAVNAGVSQYILWTDSVQVSTHSVLVKSASFHFVGSAPTDSLANVGLFIDGSKVASSTGINSLGYVVFDLSSVPFSLATGSHTVDVRGDIIKGSYRSIQLTLQNAGDFMATDSQIGVNIASKYNNLAFAPAAGPAISVNQGTLSFQLDPTFTTMTNVTGGATNALIGKYTVSAYGEDMKIQTIVLTPTLAGTDNTSARSINNVQLFYNGSQVGSAQSYVSTALTFNLGSSFIVPAGTVGTFEVHADMIDAGGDNYITDTIQVTSASVTVAQGMNSLQTTTAAIPDSTILTAVTGTLSVAANSGYTAQSFNPNTANAKIASFVLQNQTSSESVRVTNLKIGVTETDATSTNLTNLKTSETSGSGATPIALATAASTVESVNNFSVDFTLAPGATKVVDVFADIGADVANTIATRLSVTARGASSNVSADQNDKAGQAITVATGTFANAGVVISSTSQPQLVAAGSTGATDATVATYNFKSASGSATVSELKFLITTTGAHLSVSSVRVGSVSAPVVSNIAYLTSLNIAVPNGGSGVNVPVYFTYGPVGTNGNTSGDTSEVEMTYIKYTVGGTTGTLVGGSATAGATAAATGTLLATATAGTLPALLATAADITVSSNALLQPGMRVIVYNSSVSATIPDSIAEVQSLSGTAHVNLVSLKLGTAALGATSTLNFFSVPMNPTYPSVSGGVATVGNGKSRDMAGITVLGGSTSGLAAMQIVGSKPSLAVIDATTLLTNGLVKVGSVSVAADPKGDISVSAIPLLFASTGNVASTLANDGTIVVKNAADNSTISTSITDIHVLTGGLTDGTATVNFTGGYTVTAGNTVTFDIYVNTTGVTGGPSANALSMKLGTNTSFVWTDIAGSATSTTTGKLIYNYPTNSSVIND